MNDLRCFDNKTIPYKLLEISFLLLSHSRNGKTTPKTGKTKMCMAMFPEWMLHEWPAGNCVKFAWLCRVSASINQITCFGCLTMFHTRKIKITMRVFHVYTYEYCENSFRFATYAHWELTERLFGIILIWWENSLLSRTIMHMYAYVWLSVLFAGDELRNANSR